MSDDLAYRVASTLLAREGTAPVWGLVLDEARTGYARIRMAGRSSTYQVAAKTADGRVIAQFQGLSRTVGGAVTDEKEMDHG